MGRDRRTADIFSHIAEDIASVVSEEDLAKDILDDGEENDDAQVADGRSKTQTHITFATSTAPASKSLEHFGANLLNLVNASSSPPAGPSSQSQLSLHDVFGAVARPRQQRPGDFSASANGIALTNGFHAPKGVMHVNFSAPTLPTNIHADPPSLSDGTLTPTDRAEPEQKSDDLSPPGSPESEARPCDHNNWDDVRTRNGVKVLRCRVCQKQFKLISKTVPRCAQFLQEGTCEKPVCSQLHVHKKKKPLNERHNEFGEDVLKGVPAKTVCKVLDRAKGAESEKDVDKKKKKEQQTSLACLKNMYEQHASRVRELAALITAREKKSKQAPTICAVCSMTVSLPFCALTGARHESAKPAELAECAEPVEN
ncbi:hypothetical protein DIPPA_34795 [Diplonema papillatum]|nr:hypothetical protein DIPPA_04850 [Diplonema papillatum]KAJ9437768.1 hypothetical protein DIPPA_14042 [Diplonema papillatum]KAJ9446056.1 hypothetical protein DIPPA_34795 [Diplonema papillatum]